MKNLLLAIGLLLTACAPAFAMQKVDDDATKLYWNLALNPYRDEETGQYTTADGTYETWREMFKQTENRILDWAIASSVEAGYARDMIEGRNAVIAQFPIIFVSRYFDIDFGYISGYEQKSRGALMIGGTLRVNRLIEDAFKGDYSLAQKAVGADKWDRLFIGPYIAHGFMEDELLAGVKGGFKFDDFIFWK